MTVSDQKQFTIPGRLLTPDGELSTAGWARQPILDCNLEDAHFYNLGLFQPMRIKRWDYYGITTPDHFFSFTLSDVGYLCMIFAYGIDFTTGKYHEETLTLPLGGHVQLPRNSTEGETSYSNGKVSMRFNVEPGARTLDVRWPGFGGQAFNASVRLKHPKEHESLTIVIPIEGKRFYYNRKINCMPAEGSVEYGGQTYRLDPRTCLGNLDWGRGVWAYKSFWVWASASGFLPGGHTIGLNLGYGFGDTSAASENAVILDGRVHKLGRVDFKYSSANFKAPWQMTSPDGRLRLEFTPFLERVAKTDALILASEVHQMFGKYNGVVISDEGEEIAVHDLIGFAEEHHARW
jgi:hypothetical protein